MAQDFLTSASKSLLEEAGWCYFDYSVPEDFRRLWALDAKAAAMGTAPARIAIDWRGAPPGPPGFLSATDFVTPIDWMFGRAYAMQGLGQTKPCEVLIIDRRPRMAAATFADEFRLALIDALPEMKVFSAFGGPTRDYVALQSELRSPTARVVPGQVDDRRDSSPHSTAPNHSPARLAALRDAWLSYTVRSRDHHDLSNLLGPLALGEVPGGDPSDGPSAVRAALYTMVDWLQLCEDRPREQATSWISGTTYERLADAAPIDAILVDDQAELGWARVVAGALGIADAPTVLSGSHAPTAVPHGTGRLYYTIAPAALLDALKNRLAPQDPFAKRIQLPGGAEDQVVFLDLRLFPRRGVDERQFYVDLCREVLGAGLKPRWQHDDHFSSTVLSDRDRKILEALVRDPDKLLPPVPERTGPAFLRCASAILEDDHVSWQRITESSLYDYLLTLLPRYAAQLLFTTPIVLFSATGRRDLVEHFREYGNIITAFEKPHLPFGYEVVRRAFRKATNEAARLLSARRILRSIAPITTLGTPFQPGCFYHVDLFIDEAFPEDDQDFCQTGGFYAVFEADSSEQAIAKSEAFDDALAANGFAYFTRDPLLPSLPEGKRVKFKKEFAAEELRATLQGEYKPLCYGVLRLGNDLRGDSSRLNSSGDDAYRRSLGTILESYLCEVLRHASSAVSESKSVSVSIYAGQRFRGWPSEFESDARKFQYRFGLYGFIARSGDTFLVESLGKSALQPIIDDIDFFRSIRFRIERALAIRIIYDADQQGNPTYNKHDWCVCRKCRQPVPVVMADEPSPGIDTEFELCRVVGIAGERGPDWILLPLDRGMQAEIKKIRKGAPIIFMPPHIAPSCALSKGDLLYAKSEIVGSGGWMKYVVAEAKLLDRPPNRIVFRLEHQYADRSEDRLDRLRCPVCGTDTDLRPDFPGGIYIADNVLTLQREGASAFPPPAYKGVLGLGPLGFDATLSAGLEDCLDAGRAADAGDRVHAALLLAGAVRAEPALRDCRLTSSVLARLQPIVSGVTGGEFAMLVARLAHAEETATSAVAETQLPSARELEASEHARTVTLSRFEFIMATCLSTIDRSQFVEATVRGALERAGLLDSSIRLSSRLNGKRTAVVCDVVCSTQIAEWLHTNAKPDVASVRPWWGAATDPVPVVQRG